MWLLLIISRGGCPSFEDVEMALFRVKQQVGSDPPAHFSVFIRPGTKTLNGGRLLHLATSDGGENPKPRTMFSQNSHMWTPVHMFLTQREGASPA